MEKNKLRLLFVTILVVGLIIFWKSFQLGIYGDEWKIFWLAESSVHTTGRIIPASDSSYGFEIITFYLLSKIFGYEGWVYYGLSFLSRLLAAYGLFWFLRRRKMTDIAAFIGSAIFIVTPIGIETTDWVRNFDSYLGIVLFLICIDAILTLKKWTDVITIVLSFTLATLINSIRSHGLLLGVGAMLFFKFLIGSRDQKKQAAAVVCIILIVFLLFSFLNIFGGQIGMVFFSEGFQPFNQLKSLFGNFGNSIVPNFAGDGFNIQLLNFWVIMIMILVWKKSFFWGFSLIKILLTTANLSALTLLSYLLMKNPTDFSVSVSVGIYIFLILLVSASVELYTKLYTEFKKTVLVGCLGFLFMFMPSVRQPTFIASFDHRYLTYNALIVPLLAALFWNKLALFGSKIAYALGIGLIVVLLFNFSYISRLYLNAKYQTHNQQYTTKVWEQMKNYLDDYDLIAKRYVLYFTADSVDESKMYDAIIFDYNSHVGLIYQIWDDNKTPMWVINEADLKSAVTDGESIYRYIKQKRIIPKEDIIYFHIAGDKVIKRDIQTVLDK